MAAKKVKPPKKPTGRPSLYSENIADYIVAKIGNGTPMAHICEEQDMPCLRTVYDWMERMPEFSARIAKARDAGYDKIAADLLKIADSDNLADTQRAKLRIWTRLELLKRWDPKRYGDKLQQAISGADGGDLNVNLKILFGK